MGLSCRVLSKRPRTTRMRLVAWYGPCRGASCPSATSQSGKAPVAWPTDTAKHFCSLVQSYIFMLMISIVLSLLSVFKSFIGFQCRVCVYDLPLSELLECNPKPPQSCLRGYQRTTSGWHCAPGYAGTVRSSCESSWAAWLR